MYLDKIEIHGFKSFGDMVKLSIPKGITAVIGPNGSGKSNVADAIRWVLGEQSAKTLRGTKMEDIIFAGTEKRKSLGYAEVAMRIKNNDRKLPIDYEDVVVKRRVYRSGESEYFLNGSICRLKDIQELFMDTGVGKEGYSIIGQGQIDKILSSKPEDRRSLFEEAAGIYKYKVRKIEAEKKLEKEKENLLRMKDILLEIEDRLTPLEKEAEKTKEYLKLKDELKILDSNIFLEEMSQIEETYSKFAQTLANTEHEKNECHQTKEVLMQKHASWKEKHTNLINQIEQATLKLNQLEKNKVEKKSEIAINQERLASIKLLLDQIDQDAKKQKTTTQNMEIELQMLQSKKLALELEYESQNKLVEKCEQMLLKASEDLMNLEGNLQDSKEDLSEKNNEIERYKATITSQDTLEEQLEYRYTNITSNIEKLNSQVMHEETAYQVAQKEYEIQKNKVLQLEEALRQAEEIKNQAATAQVDIDSKVQKVTHQIEQMERQIKWLEQIKQGFEGYYQSVKNVLTLKKQDGHRWSGVLGTVADLIEVPKEYEIAISTALGSSMQNIVVEKEQDAKNMIAEMKRKQMGRVTFLPKDTIKVPFIQEELKKMADETSQGRASQLIGYAKEYEPIIEFLLGRIIIADSIEQASSLAKKYHYKYRIVTLEGDVFNVGGSLTGGSQKGSENNIFARARELKELKEAYNKSIEVKQGAESKQAVVMEEARCAFSTWESLKSELETNRDKEKALLFEISNKKSGVETAKRSQLEWVLEKNKLEEEKEKIKLSQTEIKQKIEQVTQEIRQSKIEVTDLEEAIKELKVKKDEQTSLLTNHKIAFSATIQNINHIKEQILSLEKTKQDINDQNQSILTRKETLIKDQEKIKEALIRIEGEIQVLEKEFLEIEGKKNLLEKDRITDQKNEVDILEQIEKNTERMHALSEEFLRLENKIEILGLEKKKIEDHLWQQYELTYTAAHVFKKDLGPLAQVKKEADHIRAKIKTIGNINVNAVVEYEETKERYEFLEKQKEDIEKAERTLKDLIEQLTEEMKEIFKEQFALIAENFTAVFKELFGGGIAFLQLTDEENILEAGIEIIAKPPGKKLQNMTLLSGGERTLTAIALLFGILQLKPSPFCVLDEIEAALDDANVLRFAQYLNSLCSHTQFVIITHRKGTMQRADTLYGVTMQERGVSTVLSIKLEDANLYLDQKTS
jgi:chromosome segregation protein